MQLCRASIDSFRAGRISVSNKKSSSKKKNQQTMERRKPSGKPENIDRRIEGDTFPEGCKSKSSLKKFRLKALKKEGSSRHRLRAKYAKDRQNSGSSATRPAWALAFGLPAAEPEDLRPPRSRSRLDCSSHFQTVRGRGLHETSRPREHSCWHPSRPQPRSHPAPTLLRASDWSGAPLAARPRTRKLRAK